MHSMKRLSLCLCLLFVVPFLLIVAGCSQPEKPSASSGYYDGKMTPAGGGKKTGKGSAE